MSDEAYVRRFGFRKFEGIRLGRFYRVLTISWFNLIESIRRSGFTKMLLVFMFFSLLVQDIFAIMIGALFPESFLEMIGITVDELFRGTFIDSILGLVSLTNRITTQSNMFISFFEVFTISNSFMYVLLLSIVGGGMISDDILNRTTEAYYSRISRFEYILGKLIALMIFSGFLVILPTFIQYFLLTQGLGLSIISNIDLLLWAIGFTVISSIILSILVLAFSSLTKRRNLATLAFFISAVVLSALPLTLGAMYQEESIIFLMDFVGVLALMGTMMLGYGSIEISGHEVFFNNGIGLEGSMVLGVVAAMAIIGIILLLVNVYRRDD